MDNYSSTIFRDSTLEEVSEIEDISFHIEMYEMYIMNIAGLPILFSPQVKKPVNWNAIKHIAHKWKTSSQFIGAHAVAFVLEKIEVSAMNEDIIDVSRLISILEAKIKDTIRQIRQHTEVLRNNLVEHRSSNTQWS